MTTSDFNSGPNPLEEPDPLSATGMFLRSFDSETQAPQDQPQGSPFKPAAPQSGPGTTRVEWPPEQVISQPAAAPAASKPGEFTQMFQTLESRHSAEPPRPVPQGAVTQPLTQPIDRPIAPPVPPPVATQKTVSESQPAASPAPGEFTRIFVTAAAPPAEQRAPIQSAKTIVESPQFNQPPANPSRMKGFSSPGVSDSASAEGSFTQFFKATPASTSPATPPPAQRAPVYTPPTPAPPPPMQANEWQPDFESTSQPTDSAASSPSATGLLSSLSGPGMLPPGSRQPDVAPYRPEPVPTYTPSSAPPPAEPSAIESGSVTRLIQRLSQVPREAAPEPVIPQAHTPAPPPANSGPGEFTRMISGDAVRTAINAAVPPLPATPAAPPPPAAPHFAMPAVTPPAFHAPAAPPPPKVEPPKFEQPKFEPPKIAAPKPAPPALAAPKGKLEAMVPILLIINTFLLVILLVVVIFAMKAK